MPDDAAMSLPKWAVDLTVEVAKLNERLGPHIDWVERNVLDHEKRLRVVEARPPCQSGEEIADHENRLRILEATRSSTAWIARLVWVFIGAITAGGVTVVVRLIGG